MSSSDRHQGGETAQDFQTKGAIIRGTVMRMSRRSIMVAAGNDTLSATSVSQLATTLCVGDTVGVISQGDQYLVNELFPRHNILSRSYREETREVAANLDCIYIVNSILPIFQPEWIDRLITVARTQEIPVGIIVNKSDLGVEGIDQLITLYKNLGHEVLVMSAKYGHGLHELRLSMQRRRCTQVAFAGVSGVGKSSIINALIPHATQLVGELSDRNGRGKQTTSQAVGYHSEDGKLIVIDLPGIQNFGVAHLSEEDIRFGLSEIVEYAKGCRYSNCAHTLEEECAVQEAVQGGAIAISRYSSYCAMLAEVKAAKKY